jgi:hypothetical protein
MYFHELFNVNDYRSINKDLHFNTDDEYITHYENIGFEQMRLINKHQLIVNVEFGFEVTTYIPYYLYLFSSGLLFDNIIHTFNGMETYYYFLSKNQLNLTRKDRHDVNNVQFMIVNFDIPYHLDLRYWIAPQYKTHFKNNVFIYDKPLLIINNKYSIEWHQQPINFLNTNTIEELIKYFNDKYQIVYIRPVYNINYVGFSNDDRVGYTSNQMLIHNDLKDFELLRSYKNVLTIDDVFSSHRRINNKRMSYNEIKCMLYANCDNYITVQGGGTNMLPYFAKKTVILHKWGLELSRGFYDGFFKEACPNLYENSKVCRSDEEVLPACIDMFS